MNFYFGHIFWTVDTKTLILHICMLCWKTFHWIPTTLTFWPCRFPYLWKNFNLGHNFWTVRVTAFKFHTCNTCEKTLHWIPRTLTLWPWRLTYFKKAKLTKTFKGLGLLLSYFKYLILVTSPFILKQQPLTLWPLSLIYLSIALTLAITSER